MWTDISRNYFFNAGFTEAESDAYFLERYCSPRLLKHMNHRGNHISAVSLRRLLNRISEICPDLEQTAPGWSRSNANRLMVLLGRGKLQWKPQQSAFVLEITRPRFGIYGHEGRLYLWTDRETLEGRDYRNPKNGWEPLDGYVVEDWLSWPTTDDGKLYYRHHLIDERGDWNPSASLADEAFLAMLINHIQETLDPPHFVLSELFESRRFAMGVPEEFAVAYPKLIHDLSSSDRGNESGEAGASQEKNDNPTSVQEGESPSPEPAIPAPVGLDQLALARHDALGIGTNQDSDYLIDAPEAKGRFYVYALIDPTQNSKPFYIGKGFHDRATQHFRTVRPDETANRDETHPDQEMGLTQGGESASIFKAELERNEPDKSARIQELLAAGHTSSDMIRVIARGLSESAAFAVEALTIKSVYGQHALTNEVAGHHDERFRFLNDWNHLNGFDLPVDTQGNLRSDTSGESYVYVLRDPTKTFADPECIFYVGKGNGNRLCQHFTDARCGLGPGVARLDRIRHLLAEGYKPKDIGRIVARVNSDALAYVIESFYIKFVIGFGNLTNIQPGHLYGMFRSKNDWERRHGFDLPTEVGGSRRELLDAFLGEGLDAMIYEIIEQLESEGWVEPYNPKLEPVKLHGAGELGVLLKMSGVTVPLQLRIQVRCARRVQVFLIPSNVEGKHWMHEKFKELGMTLRRKDAMFGPKRWWGANNLATSSQEALDRAKKLIGFAQALQAADSTDELTEYREIWE